MEFFIWMAIGVSLMAVELVVPGGILGLIGYCAFLWGRLCSSWGRYGSIVCRARINSLVNCHYHRVL